MVGVLILGTMMLGGCSTGAPDDPAAILADARLPLDRHRMAIMVLETTATPETTLRVLKGMIGSDEYDLAARVLAYERLRVLNPDVLESMLELQLPRITRTDWREWVCEAIARDSWTDLTPTLIRAWARPVAGWTMASKERPERLALVSIFGEDRVADVLMQVMLDANPVTAANLRTRCWELLVAEGSDETLRTLVVEAKVLPKRIDRMSRTRWNPQVLKDAPKTTQGSNNGPMEFPPQLRAWEGTLKYPRIDPAQAHQSTLRSRRHSELG